MDYTLHQEGDGHAQINPRIAASMAQGQDHRHNCVNTSIASPASAISVTPDCGREAVHADALGIKVRGRGWEVVNISGTRQGQQGKSFVAFTLELETTAGIELLVVRWSLLKALDDALKQSAAERGPQAHEYIKNLSKMLARGDRFGFFGGSNLDPKTANLRLVLSAIYIEALLQVPLLREEENVHVKAFLRHARVCGSFVKKGQNEQALATRTMTKTSGEQATAVVEETATAESVPRIEETPAAGDPVESIALLPPPQQQQTTSSASRVCNWSTNPAAKGPLPLSAQEENVRKAFKILLFDSCLLGPHLYGHELGQLSTACKEWSGAAELHVTVLKPGTRLRRPCSRLRALVVRKRKGYIPRDALGRQAKDSEHGLAKWDRFIKGLQHNKMPNLQQLDLEAADDEYSLGSGLGYQSVRLLAASFCNIPKLLDLNLSYCNIGPQGALALAEGLCHTPHLRLLDLSGNNIGDEGMRAIASVLNKIPKLEALILKDFPLGPLGAESLAKNFQYVPHLKHFAFYVEESFHMSPILSKLHFLPELRCLGIKSWTLQHHEVVALGGKLASLPQLICLGFETSEGSPHPRMMAPLAEAVDHHPRLLKLVLRYYCDRLTYRQWQRVCTNRGMVEDKSCLSKWLLSALVNNFHNFNKEFWPLTIAANIFPRALIFVHPSFHQFMKEQTIRGA